MAHLQDIVTTAVEQKRRLRFWHNISRVTLTPYHYGTNDKGQAIVSGVTDTGKSVRLLRSEMIGIEIVARRVHPPAALEMPVFTQTWAVSGAT